MNNSLMFLGIICLALIAVLGVIDYVTGYEINFFIFYAAPIWLAGWYGNRRLGLLSAITCGVMWFIVDQYTGRQYSHPLIPYWNGSIRITFFLFVLYALSNIKEKLKLEQLNADYDSLTDLLNGRGFREKLDVLFPLMKREKDVYSLAFIDLDNFKHVNDSMGHAEGDKVLKSVAGVMREGVRSSDLVSRLGGDEFVVFFPNTDRDQVQNVMDGLRRKLDTAVKQNQWPIGFSIGVCTFSSNENSIEEAVAIADSLMYDVKKQEKGGVFYKDMRGSY